MLSPDFLHEKVCLLKRQIEIHGVAPKIDYLVTDLLPHRDPFLFVDKITDVDLKKMVIRGKYKVRSDNLILKGHFPEYAIWPGVLQIEMVAQLGLCLDSLLNKGINKTNKPAMGYFTRVHHALFNKIVEPEADLIISCEIYDTNSLTVILGGHVYDGPQLCSLSIIEAYLNA